MMKPLNFLICTILLLSLSACEQDETLTDQKLSGDHIEQRAAPGKVLICHKVSEGVYEVREVPLPSVNGHLSHGDILPDEDGDGYTKPTACFGSRDDCDDNHAIFNPGAQEVCNTVDDDCDGLIDEDDPDNQGESFFFADNDNDGSGSIHEGIYVCHPPSGYVSNTGDCDDEDPSINPSATDIPNDGIDQDCARGDSTTLVCDCFTMQDLQNLYNYDPWPFGWWSDVPGCKPAPYDQMLELWLTNVGQPSQNFNYSAQAGYINGLPFRSHAKYNPLTGQFDVLCGGYTTAEIAEPCRQILANFIQ